MMRPGFTCALLVFLPFSEPAWSAAPLPAGNLRSLDGSGNNLSQAEWGAAKTPMPRAATTGGSSGAYYPDDGSGATFAGGPGSGTSPANPREISNWLYDDHGRSKANRRHLSHMVWQWGQFLDHDITLTETSSSPSEFAPIAVGWGDPLAPLIPFTRSDTATATGTNWSNPRQQVNSISSYIDASNVYGSDPTRAAAIRDTDNGGRLKTSAGDLLPYNTYGLPNAGGPDPSLFLGGDVRANEQVGLTAMHTLFVREHNRLAGLLSSNNPTWSDEELYQTSRKIVGAEMQAVTYGEFLPALLGRRHARRLRPGRYDYDDSLNASISNEFATSIYRFGHSMLPEELPLAAVGDAPAGSLPLAQAFFDPAILTSDASGATRHLEQILLGLSHGVAQEIDTKMTDGVRNFLFGPPGAGGMDLAALNIHRGRDHGLPLYNDMRVAYGLSPASSFRDITHNHKLRRRLRKLYDSVDEVDSWVGMLAEDHVRGSSVGELALAAMVEQFTALRDGDRFFFTGDPELMDNLAVEAVIDLNSITLSEIIANNTSLSYVPENVFRVDPWSPHDLFADWSDHWHDFGEILDHFCWGFGHPDAIPPGGGLLIVNVPEPSTGLLAAGLGMAACFRRRHISRSNPKNA